MISKENDNALFFQPHIHNVILLKNAVDYFVEIHLEIGGTTKDNLRL